MSYPVISQIPLDPVAKQGFLSKPRRLISSLPRQLPHQRLVFEYDGTFVLGDRRLRGDEPHVLHAASVSVVDVARDHPTTIQVPINSSGAHDFTVAIQFRCTVDEPIEVVRAGLTDVTEHLITYIQGYPKLFELGRNKRLHEVHELWTLVHAQVKAYTTVVPCVLPGMTAEFAGLNVYAPDEIAQGRRRYETSLHNIQGEHGLRDVKRKLDRDFELDEQDFLHAKGHSANDFTRQEAALYRDHQITEATKIRDLLNSGPGAADGLFVTVRGLSDQQIADRYAALGDREYNAIQRRAQLEHDLQVVQARARAEVVRTAIAQGLFNETTGKELLASFDEVEPEAESESLEGPAYEARAEVTAGDADDDFFPEEDVRG
ncbi:hypothetical protein [Nonomuraea roseoviolacea]|uniref:Band 7 domain-containing protein n=1 Tax=Nonomuraea roseoviolacea subsp. carminata TaxID=160689 RepID=A0ABT1K0R2_9ACTN|nr:hypothetical protein [Nonomuraea roseoviolacea]MCP2347591.1 hypothetical protein [Nonomuraea roseoviolacea subsp. carminata]